MEENKVLPKNNLFTEKTVLDYWNARKDECKELYKLAEVILSISPTQVIVERSFSTLSYVFNSLRNRLSPKNLDDILIISLNENLFREINDNDLNELNKKK